MYTGCQHIFFKSGEKNPAASQHIGPHGFKQPIWIFPLIYYCSVFPCSSEGKESACIAGDLGSTPGSERSPGEENRNPLQYSCLENPMDTGAWKITVYGVTRVGHN